MADLEQDGLSGTSNLVLLLMKPAIAWTDQAPARRQLRSHLGTSLLPLSRQSFCRMIVLRPDPTRWKVEKHP